MVDMVVLVMQGRGRVDNLIEEDNGLSGTIPRDTSAHSTTLALTLVILPRYLG